MRSIIFLLGLTLSNLLFAQTNDYVDVTFYYHPDKKVNAVHLPGEFNNWSINSSSLMVEDSQTGTWTKTYRLRVGGPNPLPASTSIPGAYQYKLYVDGNWIQDPLNPMQNEQDNNNSYLFVNSPTIYQLLPNSTSTSGIIRTRFPKISAYIFPSISNPIDLSSLVITIDGNSYSNLEPNFDSSINKLTFTPTIPIGDGVHNIIIAVNDSNDSSVSETATFTSQSGLIQLLTLDAETWKNSWKLQGAIFNNIGGFDSTVTNAQILRNDSVWSVNVINGKIDTTLSLIAGDNIFSLKASVGQEIITSDSINIFRKINHSPFAQIDASQNGSSLTFTAINSSDPDEQNLNYSWRESPDNPELLGISGNTDQEINTTTPTTFGEYYISLIVEDPDLNIDSTKIFFTINSDSSSVQFANYEDNPSWLKNARIYTMFFKAFTSTGTIRAAIPNLNYVKAMGFNVIWVLPVMEILGNVDNQINIGYYIKDFYKVENSYGTSKDFKDFVEAAHQLNLKVILDVTPNHTGKFHPFAQEALTNGDFSQYWNYYQTNSIAHNTNGLGECVTPEGLYYYCAFSDVLLNYNWKDIDARKYMIDVYNYWVKEFGVDGYRFDVYWGPQRRYGNQYMGKPVRESLKHLKPDILLLGEDDGVGPGTEVLYADQGGGLDASYDFRLYFDAISNFNFTTSAINTLHSKLDNNGFYPGQNSYYLRFMESQDEDRISYKYNSFEKTMPIASSVFMAPGMPMILNGQEVGFGKGMGAPGEPDLNDRRRGIVDWNFGGKDLLTPHYQKLAQIRAQFPSFSQHRQDTNGDGSVNNQDESDFDRIATGNNVVYSFLRPFKGSNGLAIVNFSNSNQNVSLNLTNSNLKFDNNFDQQSSYWVNDLYNGTSTQVIGSELSNLAISLSPYGTSILTISDNEEMVNIPPLPSIVSVNRSKNIMPDKYILYQNYPNPFNPSTTINYSIPNVASSFSLSKVTLRIYDILGREITTLVNGQQKPGNYEVEFNGRNLSSGIYFYTLSAGDFFETKKMIMLK